MAENFLIINARSVEKYFETLRRTMPKVIGKISKEYVNNQAFEAKKESATVLEQNFDFRNNSTRKYTNRAVTVEKAKKVGDPSVFGVKKSQPKRQQFNREILVRQEVGGSVRQLNSSGGYRKQMVTQGKSVHGKKTPRLQGKTVNAKKETNKKRQMAKSFAIARRKGKTHAATPFGVYRVLKRKARKITGYKPDRGIKTTKKPFVAKTVRIVLSRDKKLLNKSVNYVMNKERARIERKLKG